MKKTFIIFLLIFFFNNYVWAFSDIYSNEYLEQYQNYIMRKERFDALNYNALGLSPEQIKQYKDIALLNNDYYQKKLDKIKYELEKYQIMKECDLPSFEIKQQKQYIKRLYREISKISHNEKIKLKKILNKEQRKTYNTMKHLERHDLKKELYPKNYYNLNPKMSVFGNLKE